MELIWFSILLMLDGRDVLTCLNIFSYSIMNIFPFVGLISDSLCPNNGAQIV